MALGPSVHDSCRVQPILALYEARDSVKPRISDEEIDGGYKVIIKRTEHEFGDKPTRRFALASYRAFWREKNRAAEARPYEEELKRLGGYNYSRPRGTDVETNASPDARATPEAKPAANPD